MTWPPTAARSPDLSILVSVAAMVDERAAGAAGGAPTATSPAQSSPAPVSTQLGGFHQAGVSDAVGALQVAHLALLRLVCAVPQVAWRAALTPLAAALLSAGFLLLWQKSEVREEALTEQAKVQKLHSQLDELRQQLAKHSQLAQAERAANVDEFLPASTATSGTEADLGPWHWQRLARAAGLTVDLLKPLEGGGAHAASHQLQLRVRGRYRQHGVFVAALADATQAVRVRRYQLQSGAGGVHLADIHLELPAKLAQSLLARAQHGASQGRSFQLALGLDPLAELRAAEPWAGMPVHWRAEVARAKLILEASPLSAYALAGTLQRGGEWLALLQDERMLHTVRVGDSLGPNAGRVLHIAEHGLWLREIVRDSEGRWNELERLWRVGEKP